MTVVPPTAAVRTAPPARRSRRFLATRLPVALATVLVMAATAVLSGCGGSPVSPTKTAAQASSSAVPPGKRVVLLDPGHNGGNAANPAAINKQVPDGRGGTKPCNTTGTATNSGYPEHKFNWDVTLRVAQLLVTNDVGVRLTRRSDKGVGPCVDVRGEMAAKYDVDAEVSIHADGAPPAGHGFHVAYPRPALNTAQGAPSLALATSLRDALTGAGLPTSSYLGKSGLAPRADLAGLNLSKRPIALVECANMRNPGEAVTVSSAAGRARYAQAIAVGIMNWLARLPPKQGSTTAASAGRDDSPEADTPSESAKPTSSARSRSTASPRTTRERAPAVGSAGTAGTSSGGSAAGVDDSTGDDVDDDGG